MELTQDLSQWFGGAYWACLALLVLLGFSALVVGSRGEIASSNRWTIGGGLAILVLLAYSYVYARTKGFF